MLTDITPDKSLVKKLGLSGYRTEQALAELVDNSIDARIPGHTTNVVVRLDFDGRSITVTDDGRGMDGAELAEAMVIARSAKDADKLGQFGMGMKGACSALGKRFEIITSPEGSGAQYRVKYDETEWLGDASKGWDNFEVEETRAFGGEEDWHGTRVEISFPTVPLYPNQTARFRDRFGLRYSPYLESGQVAIRVNTLACRPASPALAEGSEWVPVNIDLGFGMHITGRLGLLEKRSVGGRYGIHLFKNGRLIRAFEKFGFPPHPENSRLIGELSLDHVPVNFNKSRFIENARYAEALDEFRKSKVLSRMLRSSKPVRRPAVSIASVMDYFGGRGPARRMERRVGATESARALGAAVGGEFSVRTPGGIPVKVSFGDADGPLYAASVKGGAAEIRVNTGSAMFGLVGNPAFLAGLVASEAEMVSRNPGSAAVLEERNARVEDFVREWTTAAATGGGAGRVELRDREVPVPDIYGYGLYNDLIEVHDFLKDNFAMKFQFTALSTLRPYLHNMLGRAVYTVHTLPGNAETAAGLIMDEFGNEIVAAAQPGPKMIMAFFNAERVRAMVAVREYMVIPGSTVASPAKAFADLIIEKSVHKAPIHDDEPRMVLYSMLRRGLVDMDQVRRHVRRVKQTRRLEQIIEAGPA